MENKGQISLETLIGAIVFLFFFMGIVAFSTAQGYYLEDEKSNLSDTSDCLELSQIIHTVKQNDLVWQGNLDKNYYIKNNTIYVNYSVPFNGIYCKIINTNQDILINGEVRIYSFNDQINFEVI